MDDILAGFAVLAIVAWLGFMAGCRWTEAKYHERDEFDQLWEQEPDLDPAEEYARLERERKIARNQRRYLG